VLKNHKIESKIKISYFIELIRCYSKHNIFCTDHTFFRLSENQRKLFKCEHLKELLLNEIPLIAGIQLNKRYTAIYEYKKDLIRIVMSLHLENIEIVTFYIIKKKPRIK